MENILTVLHIIVTVFLIVVVLMQRSEGGGVGLGTVSTGGLVSVRGQANFMTKLTGTLAALFIVLSLAIAILSVHGGKKESSLMNKLSTDSETSAPVGTTEPQAEPKAEEPSVPLAK